MNTTALLISIFVVVVVAVYADFRFSKRIEPPRGESTAKKLPPQITVPTEEQLKETFEAYQKGGDALLELIKSRQAQQQLPQQPMEPKPETKREITALPGETVNDVLRRMRQMPRKDGESKLVTVHGDFGPMSFIPLPNVPSEPPLLSDEENEENFRIYYERQRRRSRGIPPNAKEDDDPTKS